MPTIKAIIATMQRVKDMKHYKVYAKPIQNNIGNETVYVQNIQAKNKNHACESVGNMIENRSIYQPGTYFAVLEQERDRIEKALPSKKYAYVGHSRATGIYHIFRPAKKGRDWYIRHSKNVYPSHFCRTLAECNQKLSSI